MVDLVKIRRKAKERKEREEAERREATPPDHGPEENAAATGASAPNESLTSGATAPPSRTKKQRGGKKTRNVAPASPSSESHAASHVEPSAANAEAASVAEAAPAAVSTEVAAEARDRVEEFRRRAGLRRDTTDAADETREESADDRRVEVLVFEISRERYAVEIDQIREITPTRAFTRVPNAELSVVGIISLRGTIVTILDVRSRLGHREAPPATDDTRIIVVEQQSEIAGFVVDRVYRVLAIDRESIEANPVVAAGEHSRYIRGVFRYNERITILLDLERLLEQQGD